MDSRDDWRISASCGWEPCLSGQIGTKSMLVKHARGTALLWRLGLKQLFTFLARKPHPLFI